MASSDTVLACESCGLAQRVEELAPGMSAECIRCGSTIATRPRGGADAIGPWAMLDVFLLAILVALVKLGDLARVIPGPGLVAFTCVVVFTMLASQSFDPKTIWNKQ